MTPAERQSEIAYRTTERLGHLYGSRPVTPEEEEAARHEAHFEVLGLEKWENKQKG